MFDFLNVSKPLNELVLEKKTREDYSAFLIAVNAKYHFSLSFLLVVI